MTSPILIKQQLSVTPSKYLKGAMVSMVFVSWGLLRWKRAKGGIYLSPGGC